MAKYIHKIFIFFLQASLISCSLSVSFSQLFLFLSLIFYILDKEKPNFVRSPIFFAGSFIFISYLLSAFWNYFFGIGFSSKGNEAQDVFLFGAFFCMSGIKKEDIPKIRTAILLMIFFILFTGFISIFTKVRLARLISDLYTVSKNWKFTHHYGDVFGIGIHLPIGLMNTHLTFGGLLLFFYPYFFFRSFLNLKYNFFNHKTIYSIFFLVAYTVVLLLNNARSAIFGAIISLIFGFIHLVFIKKELSIKFLAKTIITPLIIFIILIIFLLQNETTSKTIRPLFGEEKHTDSGRNFIWHSSVPLFLSNPIFGVGPGNYNKSIEKTRKELSEKEVELSYFYEVTQRGHAHNDYLHLLSVSGILGFISYILLAYFIIGAILNNKSSPSNSILFYGLAGFFFASLFQCYFQDDEVVIIFWYLTGYLNRCNMES